MAHINLHNVSVRFQHFDAFHRSFKPRILGYGSGGENQSKTKNKIYFNALTDVNLKLEAGDRVAVFGGNGSGKTTLLRVLSGLLVPKNGTAEIIGSTASVLNIGFGFDPESTVQDTIRLKGIMSGYDNEEINRVTQEIITYASLESVLDFPLINLPLGIVVSLAIAMSFSFKADIIVWDEILEALDLEFHEKINSHLKEPASRDTIIIIADRSKALLNELCNKAIVLEKGRLVAFGGYSDIFSQWGGEFVL